MKITREFLDQRLQRAASKGFSKQKWIEFCEHFLERGFKLSMYEARATVSKYVKVHHEGKYFIVRFSNHRPNQTRELRGDSDFFVGVTHTGVRTTADAINAVNAWIERKMVAVHEGQKESSMSQVRQEL